jgi:hypothetical protein
MLRSPVLVFVVAVFSATAAVGCGGNPADMAATTGIEAAMYGSQEYGFSFRYPQRCALVTPERQSAPGGPVLQVIVADPDGGVVKGAALDVFSVEVYKLIPAASPDDLKAHTADFRPMAMELAGSSKGLRIVAEPTLSSLGGEPALAMEYFSGRGETRVGTVAYFIPKGDHVYWVRLQSSSKTKGSSTMVLTLSTFKFD